MKTLCLHPMLFLGLAVASALVVAFSGAYVLSTLLVTPLPLTDGYLLDLGGVMHELGPAGSRAVSFFHTGMVASGAILAIRIQREAVSRNDFFRLSRKPFAIAIAGDSGAGKNHFANALTDLFGEH